MYMFHAVGIGLQRRVRQDVSINEKQKVNEKKKQN